MAPLKSFLYGFLGAFLVFYIIFDAQERRKKWIYTITKM